MTADHITVRRIEARGVLAIGTKEESAGRRPRRRGGGGAYGGDGPVPDAMMGLARARPIRWVDPARELSAHRAALQGNPRHAARRIPGAIVGNNRRCDLALRTFGPSPPYVAMGAVVVARCVQIDRGRHAGRIARIRKPWWQIRNIA